MRTDRGTRIPINEEGAHMMKTVRRIAGMVVFALATHATAADADMPSTSSLIHCIEDATGTTITLATDIPSYRKDPATGSELPGPPPILRGDVTGDGEPDVVVAYYDGAPSPPDDEQFFMRAHVALFDGSVKMEKPLWISTGWGSDIRSRMSFDLPDAAKAQIADNYFRLMDIDGNGILDIVLTRASYGAMGSSLNGWSAVGGKIKEILQADSGRIVKDPETGETLLICDNVNRSHGESPSFRRLGVAGKAEGFTYHELTKAQEAHLEQ
jgi:hypothetical protein